MSYSHHMCTFHSLPVSLLLKRLRWHFIRSKDFCSHFINFTFVEKKTIASLNHYFNLERISIVISKCLSWLMLLWLPRPLWPMYHHFRPIRENGRRTPVDVKHSFHFLFQIANQWKEINKAAKFRLFLSALKLITLNAWCEWMVLVFVPFFF